MTQKNCSICKSKLISKVHDEIREFKNDVYRCKNCETVFLNDYKSINYKEDYGTKLFDSSWNVDKILSERSKSLKDVIKKINDIIEKKNCNDILELGPGFGSSLIDLKKKNKTKNFFCLEQNKNYISIIKNKTKTKIYSNLKNINKKFDLIYAIHFIEHIENPVIFLKNLKKIIKKNGYLFLVTPNHDDFYMYSLPKNNLKKYKSFIYHAAHPFYYSKNSLNFILKKSGYFNNTISTDQDYSILNFMNWFSHGKPSENISTAKKIPKNIKKLDILFKKYINESDLGSNLWSISIN